MKSIPTFLTCLVILSSCSKDEQVKVSGESAKVFEDSYEKGRKLLKEKKYEEAFPLIKAAAEQGHVEAQSELGFMYRHGKGTLKDPNKAFEWYKKAAEQGDAKAQCRLGFMYDKGEGTPKDLKKAFEWLIKAAEQGDAKYQYFLGYRYQHASKTEWDPKKAIEWYKKAAEQGHAEAQFGLGVMYKNKNPKKAVEWWTKAAEQGHADAQLNLGSAYLYGQGTLQDLYQAARWIKKASESNDTYIKEDAEKYWNRRELWKYAE